MKILPVFLILYTLFGCHYNNSKYCYNKEFKVGNMENIKSDSLISLLIKIADSYIVKEGYVPQDYNRNFYQDSENYVVRYLQNNPKKLGGDAVLIFEKKSLKLICKKLEE